MGSESLILRSDHDQRHCPPIDCLQYGYDALGRRAWRKSDQGTRHYLWHKEVLLGEQNPDGQWQWYLRDPQTDAPLLTLIAGTPHYYELDWRLRHYSGPRI